MRKVALIGYGAIARITLEQIAENNSAGLVNISGVVVRQNREAETRSALGDSISVVTSVEELIRLAPNIIAECAGQEAVHEYAKPILLAGIDLMVISTGALGDNTLRNSLIKICKRNGTKIVVPSGAIAGLDGLNSLRIGGLETVTYDSTKPPLAWKGTPAEQIFDLKKISKRTELYTGPARSAAKLYPNNANLAVTVALAGVGLEKTRIQLIADPNVAPNNVGEIIAKGKFGELRVECRGLPAPENPKTSATTALSLAHAILKKTNTILT